MKTNYKIIAALLVVVAAIIHLAVAGYPRWDAHESAAYTVLMFYLFSWKEKPEDERVRELKLKALYCAFAIGFIAAIAAKQTLRFSARPGMPMGMSAFDLLFVMFVVAFALFHYWRFQDGRAVASAEAGREPRRGAPR